MEEKAELTFEQAMDRLEDIVRELDSGGQSLSEAVELFEEGIGLVKECSLKLSDAQSRLEKLVKRDDESVTLEPCEE